MHLHQVKPIRAAAFAANVGHFRTVFIDGNADYAIPAGAVSSEERLHKLSAFIFWTSWAASTTRPGDIASYTNNWPHEPKFQRLGVNVLFLALLLVVLGSLSGEWLSVHNKMSDTVSFYFGHQGYEYVDLGRFWQIALMVGLLLWLVLMMRVLWRHDLLPRSSRVGLVHPRAKNWPVVLQGRRWLRFAGGIIGKTKQLTLYLECRKLLARGQAGSQAGCLRHKNIA